MKNFIKTLLTASLILAGVSLQAVTPETIAKLDTEREAQEKLRAQETIPTIVITPPNEGKLPTTFEQFEHLPKEIQIQILTAINEAATPYGAAKRLSQLRRVNHRIKDIIESPYSGKLLMQKIADRFPMDRRGLLDAAFILKTPGALAWVKEKIESGAIQRDVLFDAALVDGVKNKLNAQQIIQLIDDPNYSLRGPLGNYTILLLAVSLKDITLIRDLIDAGANVNLISTIEFEGNHTPVTALDSLQQTPEIYELLRARGGKTAAELGQGQ